MLTPYIGSFQLDKLYLSNLKEVLMMARQTKANESKFEDQVRFNWGYHDARHEAKFNLLCRDVSGHFDKVYAAGYKAGWVSDPSDKYSDGAWGEYRATIREARATRKQIKEVRPSPFTKRY